MTESVMPLLSLARPFKERDATTEGLVKTKLTLRSAVAAPVETGKLPVKSSGFPLQN